MGGGLASLDDLDGFDALAETGVFSLRADGFSWADTSLAYQELGRALVPGQLVWSNLAHELVGGVVSGIEHTPNGKDAGWYSKEAEHPWPAHRALLRNDVYIIEGLTNLDRIKGRRVKFSALPVILPGLSGFPVRAVAWLDR